MVSEAIPKNSNSAIRVLLRPRFEKGGDENQIKLKTSNPQLWIWAIEEN